MPDPIDLKPEDAAKPAPTIETTVTEKKVGDAAMQQLPPPPIIADDTPRQLLALAVVIQFVLVIGYMIYVGTKLDNTQMILGAEITFMTSVLNYYFGSSSGSTAKSAIIDKK